jgi:predicted transcriptional regulator of viral defense system
MPNINNINVNRANKAIYNKDARKLVARLGNNERLVLRYAVLVSRRFTISDIVTYFSNLKHRRIWDTVQRLVKKGFVRKVDRGIYELAKDIDKSVLDMDLGNTRKENLLFGDGGGG